MCRLLGGRDWCLPAGRWSWALSLRWAGLYHGVCPEAAVSSAGLLMGGAVFLRVVCPECSSTGLEAAGWDQVMIPQRQTSRRVHTDQQSLGPLPPVSLLPSEPQLTPASPGDLPGLVGRSSSGSYGITFLWCVPVVHETLCVPSKSGVSVSPSPVELLNSSPTGASSSGYQILRLDSLLWGSGLLLLRENVCDIIIFQLVGRPPGRYGV